MARAPETFTESERKDYRQAAWQNIAKGATAGATTGANIGLGLGVAGAGTSAGLTIPVLTAIGAGAGALVGGVGGLIKGSNVRRGMREAETAEQAELMAMAKAQQEAKSAEQTLAATAEKASKRAGPGDGLSSQSLDTLAANMPSAGNPMSSGRGYDFIRKEY